MGKRKAVKDSSKGITSILYRNNRARWTNEECVQENSKRLQTITMEDVAAPVISSNNVSVRDWLTQYCTESLVGNSVQITSNSELDMKIPFFKGIVCDKELVPSHAEPIDIASTEDIKTIKANNRGVEAVYETRHNCDFEMRVNAGGPIWSTAFSPDSGVSEAKNKASITTQFNKYLAVGLSRVGWPTDSSNTIDNRGGVGADNPRILGQSDTSHNLLQIWHLSGSVHQHRTLVTYRQDMRGKNSSGKPKGRPKGSFKVKRVKKESFDDDDDEYDEEDEEDINDSESESDYPSKMPRVESKTASSNNQHEPSKLLNEYFDVIDESLFGDIPKLPPPSIELSYCVHLNARGPAWQLSWCPIKLKSSSLLGVLAVVCGDGSCLVFVLPKLADKTNADLKNVPVLTEQSVCKIEIKLSPDVMITCATWNPHKPFELLCGMTNGMISGWSLGNHLKSTTNSTVRLNIPDFCLCDADVDTILPTFGSINCLEMCPYNENLLLCGCNDGHIRVWDINKPNIPLFVKQRQKIISVAWDPCGIGFYYGDQTTAIVGWENQSNETYDKASKTLQNHVYKYGGIWGIKPIIVDDHTYLISVASDGTVRGVFSSVVGYMKGFSGEGTIEFMRVNNVNNKNNSVAEVNISREKMCSEETFPIESFINRIDVAIHTLDTTPLIMDYNVNNIQCGPHHILAYGGASGILRVHSVNPLKLTFPSPKKEN